MHINVVPISKDTSSCINMTIKKFSLDEVKSCEVPCKGFVKYKRKVQMRKLSTKY